MRFKTSSLVLVRKWHAKSESCESLAAVIMSFWLCSVSLRNYRIVSKYNIVSVKFPEGGDAWSAQLLDRVFLFCLLLSLESSSVDTYASKAKSDPILQRPPRGGPKMVCSGTSILMLPSLNLSLASRAIWTWSLCPICLFESAYFVSLDSAVALRSFYRSPNKALYI